MAVPKRFKFKYKKIKFNKLHNNTTYILPFKNPIILNKLLKNFINK